MTSSLIATKHVAFLPFKIRAEHSIHGPWHMAATVLPGVCEVVDFQPLMLHILPTKLKRVLNQIDKSLVASPVVGRESSWDD